GQKQRLALAAASLPDPEVLLLDEPTSAVDPETRRNFWDSLYDLASEGLAILVSTHFMDEAERCHRLAILDEGRKVADGTPDELKSGIGVAVVEVQGADSERGRAVLGNTPGIVTVAQLGVRLRAHVEPSIEEPVAHVSGALRRASIDGHAQLVEPNLEDVFMAVTR
ncbi:MAG: AAA family ATPase, partial [Acidobacteriota bacterium]